MRAPGYRPETLTGLTVSAGAVTGFEVALQPGANGHAQFVSAVNQRDPANAHANLSSPGHALGAPDGLACSLGTQGFIVLDLGEGQAVVDGPGVDLTVTEALVPGDLVAERYQVWLGGPWEQGTQIGTGQGTASFDLAGSGAASARYVRIVDATDSPPASPLAGMELDALTVLNGPGDPTLSADVAQLSLAAGGTQVVSVQHPLAGGIYWLLGSFSGSSPGQPLPDTLLTLPLNYDGWFLLAVLHPNVFVQGSLGFLDGTGAASAGLTIPAGSSPSLAGFTLLHGAIVLDGAVFPPIHVTNTVPLLLVP